MKWLPRDLFPFNSVTQAAVIHPMQGRESSTEIPPVFASSELVDLRVRHHRKFDQVSRPDSAIWPCSACGWSLARLRCVMAGFRGKRSGDAVGGRRPARGVAAGAGSSPAAALTGRRSALAACWNVPASMVFRANTKATQVRAQGKINTRTTRTKRYSPAHGSTTAKMSV